MDLPVQHATINVIPTPSAADNDASPLENDNASSQFLPIQIRSKSRPKSRPTTAGLKATGQSKSISKSRDQSSPSRPKSAKKPSRPSRNSRSSSSSTAESRKAKTTSPKKTLTKSSKRLSISRAHQAKHRESSFRGKMQSSVESINEGFNLDFDFARLPRVNGSDVMLKIEFIVPKRMIRKTEARAGRCLCYLSPKKLENAFQMSTQYVGELGANPRGADALADSRSRYKGVLEFLTTGIGVLVSIALLDKDGSVRFIDGKHRFCVYRDLGLSCVPVLVPQDQRDMFLKHFRAKRKFRRVVRRCTKIATGSKARFDPKYNSWCKGNAAEETATLLADCDNDSESDVNSADESDVDSDSPPAAADSDSSDAEESNNDDPDGNISSSFRSRSLENV